MLAKHFVGFGRGLPDPEEALGHPEGLAGAVHDNSMPTLIAAYAKGLYPESGNWWAPAERMVLFPENMNMYVSKRVSRLLQTRAYGVSFDENSDGVLRGCAPEPALAETNADALGSDARACASRTGGGMVRGAFNIPPARCRLQPTIP